MKQHSQNAARTTLRRRAAALLVLSAALSVSAGLAQGFDWMQAKGATINVALNQHPYQAAISKKLADFTKDTGITVKTTVTPESNYFDKVTTSLFAKNGNPDVFMTGIYQSWDYATAGSMEPLDKYMNDPKLTEAAWNAKDFFPGVLNAGKWSLKVGDPSGKGSQWVLPLGFESNTLAYNKKYFDANNIKVPKTLDELAALAKKLKGWNGPGSYGLAVRGTREWATIHPGYMTAFDAAGNKDFVVKNGKLVLVWTPPRRSPSPRRGPTWSARVGRPPGVPTPGIRPALIWAQARPPCSTTLTSPRTFRTCREPARKPGTSPGPRRRTAPARPPPTSGSGAWA